MDIAIWSIFVNQSCEQFVYMYQKERRKEHDNNVLGTKWLSIKLLPFHPNFYFKPIKKKGFLFLDKCNQYFCLIMAIGNQKDPQTPSMIYINSFRIHFITSHLLILLLDFLWFFVILFIYIKNKPEDKRFCVNNMKVCYFYSRLSLRTYLMVHA